VCEDKRTRNEPKKQIKTIKRRKCQKESQVSIGG